MFIICINYMYYVNITKFDYIKQKQNSVKFYLNV